MKPVTFEEMTLHPEVVDLLHARARRARAEAMQNLAVRFINWAANLFHGAGSRPFGIRWG